MNDSNGEPEQRLTHKKDLSAEKNLALLVYALQAASFLFGITYIAAVIINYLKRQDVAGTWLESHFRWQIDTFWYSLLWGVLGGLTQPFGIGYIILLATTLWVVYRIAQGWLHLNDGQPIV